MWQASGSQCGDRIGCFKSPPRVDCHHGGSYTDIRCSVNAAVIDGRDARATAGADLHIKKTIRRALIALIALVLVAVALNYTQSWRRARVVMQAGKILGAELLRSAEGIEYSDNQNGVVRFKVHAKSLQETREGKNLLQGIEAFDFNPDGTVRNQIRSRNAEYDRDSKKAFFSGDVQVQMGEGVEIRTESLNYDLQSNVGHTNDRFRLISPQASGTAQGLRYDHANKTLELYSELDFILMRAVHKPDGSTQEEKVRVTARRGYYAQNERFMRFQGGSRVESESDILAGNNIEATFSADQKHIKSLLCQGSASYVSKDPSRSRELRGDRIQFGILPDTVALQRIDVMGQASFLSCSEDSEQELRASGIVLELDPVKGVPTKVLSQDNVRFNLKRNLERTQIAGDNLEAYFDAGTDSLKRVRVWDRAEMANRAGEAEGDELKAEEIRIAFQTVANRSALKELQAERAVKWRTPPRKKTETDGAEPGRTMTANFLDMHYANGADYLEDGYASGDVVLAGFPLGDPAKSEIRRLEADKVRFRFYPRENKLKDFEGEGHVSVFHHSAADAGSETPAQEFRTASSNMRATFRPQDGTAEYLTQWGSFVYQDGSRKATAGRGEYTAEAEVLVLREAPKITDDNGSTTGDWMEYDRKNKVLTVHKNVRSVLRQSGTTGGSPFAASSESSSPAVIVAQTMQYWTDETRARYSGNVLLLTEEGQLRSQVLETYSGGGRVEAEGEVRHVILKSRAPGNRTAVKEGASAEKPEARDARPSKRVLIQCARLRYFKEQNSIQYLDNVVLSSEDARLSSDSLDAVLDSTGRQIEKAAARGRVFVRQSGREVKGEMADYFLQPGKFVVTGNPAQISDPGRGKSAARRLTFFTTDDRILLENT